jgi:hypothetical protein
MNIRLFGLLFVVLLLAMIAAATLSCAESKDNTDKVSGVLLHQLELRRQQVEAPDEERLKQMKEMNMILSDIKTQRIFIYVKEHLTPEQEKDLAAIGVKIHPDSWIPPVGNHPYGFFIADMPIEKLETLAAKDYIIRLDTAEREVVPQCQIDGK